jgi:hypothetical protein
MPMSQLPDFHDITRGYGVDVSSSPIATIETLIQCVSNYASIVSADWALALSEGVIRLERAISRTLAITYSRAVITEHYHRT